MELKITSVNNNLIKELVKLKQKKYRDKEKKFIVEGYNIIEEAKEYLDCILITKEEDKSICPNIKHILVTKEIIKKLTDTISPQEIVGICKYKEASEKISKNVIILDGIQDPGNIGTIIRTALCFDINTIYISNESCDVYNEKVIRATQGAIFKTNIIRSNIEDVITNLKALGYYIVGTALENGKELNEINFTSKNAIILGNEGNGVSKSILSLTNVNAYIPISKDMESLNVGIAGGIIMNKLRNK